MLSFLSSLSFFQSAFLWASFFTAVILFLHFFRRKATKRMDISTLRFFSTAAVSQSKAKKLRQLLLLISRLLLIIVLILIFAGLHDKRGPLVALRDPQSTLYSWVDPAVSMEYMENGKTSGQRAEDILGSLVNILPSTVDHYYFDHESGRFLLSREKGAREFAGRFGPSNLEEAVNAFIAASAFAANAQFVMISDFKTSTAALFDSLSERLVETNKNVICVSVTPSKPWNHSVKVSGSSTLKNGVSAVIHADGADLDSSFVELVAGDLRIGQKKIVCVNGDSVQVTFDMPSGVISSGSWGKIELQARDPLPFDNIGYFALTAERGRTVLVVGNAKRNKVIAAALKAAAPDFWTNVSLKEGGELSYEDLNSADLVIVNSFSGQSRILESFISGSGIDRGIIICLDHYQERDFGVDFLQRSGFSMPAAKTIEKGANPVLTDTKSDLWMGFPNISSSKARIYRYRNPVPGTPLVRAGNFPLATFVKNPKLEFVLLSTPIGITDANNLCETGFFVPFVDRLSRFALKGNAQTENIWYAGHIQRNPFFGTERSGALYDKDAKLISAWSAQPFVKVDKPGIYSLTSSTGETSVISVSTHPDETEMKFKRPVIPNERGIYYFEAQELLEQIKNLSNNIWSNWLWVILGVALCAEALLFRK
ncbi:MAG: BatA domain-containing protein [Chitinispirillales bacterium]|jgi:hypothetical protein|nr:BatA domain-containing protein [Chitinispirillales bacterium]